MAHNRCSTALTCADGPMIMVWAVCGPSPGPGRGLGDVGTIGEVVAARLARELADIAVDRADRAPDAVLGEQFTRDFFVVEVHDAPQEVLGPDRLRPIR